MDINDTQAFYNIFENKLVSIVDSITPIEEIEAKETGHMHKNTTMKRLINRKRRKIKRQNYDVGKNILLNRMHSLNIKIEKN